MDSALNRVPVTDSDGPVAKGKNFQVCKNLMLEFSVP